MDVDKNRKKYVLSYEAFGARRPSSVSPSRAWWSTPQRRARAYRSFRWILWPGDRLRPVSTTTIGPYEVSRIREYIVIMLMYGLGRIRPESSVRGVPIYLP
jgi:hypothetical protein